MDFDAIGKNIRKYRVARKMRQEDLAEHAHLSVNYIGMIERGEKIPSLESFIEIANALSVSADMLLAEVLTTGYIIKNSLLSEKIDKLSMQEKERIYDVVDILIKHAK